MGHINCLLTVRSRLGLDRIFVVPANKNPLKQTIEGPSVEHRLAMLHIGLDEYDDFAAIDEQEIRRGGVSYTIETVSEYAKIIVPENLFLIIGLDQFEDFGRWKDFAQILELANLVVVSRPE